VTEALPDSEATPATGVAGLTRRLHAMRHELGKFVVVGGAAFVIDVAISNWLHIGLGMGPTTAKVISTVISTIASYIGNRWWSFSHRVDETTSETRDFTVFAVINLVGLVITVIPLDLIHYGLNATGTIAFNVGSIIGTAIATVFRFVAYRRWVFSGNTDAAEREALL
jgi:putative flippase GtrA